MSSQAAKRSQWMTRRSRAENCLQRSSAGPKLEERSRARRQRLSALVCSFLTWLEAPEMFFRTAQGRRVRNLKTWGAQTLAANFGGAAHTPQTDSMLLC